MATIEVVRRGVAARLRGLAGLLFGGLLRDESGVVSLLGITGAVFLTGLVYYEIGVGDAITFKEQLQDASDASGFAAAVYHARGMNMIALLNLIMAAVLAIIVVLKVLEIVFGIIAGIAQALAAADAIFAPPLVALFEGAATAAEDAETWCDRTETQVEPTVKKALQGLNTGATAIAVGMPYVALIKSATVGPMYYTGNSTIMLSMSLIPSLQWIPPVQSLSAGATDWSKLTPGGPSNLEGKRLGLPVQEGDFKTLCEQAAQATTNLLWWAANAAFGGSKGGFNSSPPSWLSWINGIIGKIAGALPEVFCDADSLDSKNSITNAAQEYCNSQQQQFNACMQQLFGPPGSTVTRKPIPNASTTGSCANGMGDTVTNAPAGEGGSNNNKSFDMGKCQSDKEKSLGQEANGSTLQSIQGSDLPKAIFAYAANGNDYLAVWSFGWSHFSDIENLGVSVASWHEATTKAAPSAAALKAADGVVGPQDVTMLSKAEFYYAITNPCTTGANPGLSWGTKGSATLCSTTYDNMPFWSDYMTSVMWNARWTARLRRVSPPMIPIGEMASQNIMSKLGDILKTYLKDGGKAIGSKNGGKIAANTVVSFITNFIEMGGGMLDQSIAGAIERAAGFLH